MEKYIIDKNRNRVIAHAKRLSDSPIDPKQVEIIDGHFAIKINTNKEIEHIESVNSLDEFAETKLFKAKQENDKYVSTNIARKEKLQEKPKEEFIKDNPKKK